MTSNARGNQVATPPEKPGDELPVLIGKHTYGSVTDKICDIILTTHTPWFWWAGFSTAFLFLGLLGVTVYNLVTTGIGIFEPTFRSPGVPDREFCLVDWDRACRHVHFGVLAVAKAGVAHVD